jgi:uncharacterized membrane protein
MQALLDWVAGSFPPEVATMLIGMIPVTELRASVPIAMTLFGMSAQEAIFWSVVGDAIPTLGILYLLRALENFLRPRSRRLDNLFQRTFDKASQKFQGKYEKYGMLALTLFVAIPLPGTGSWTGATAAVLFSLPRAKSWAFIVLGLALSGIIIALVTHGAINVFNS